MKDTRQRIVEAALRVFNEDHSAPLEQVAAEAAVTRRTLHRHFTSREDLLAVCARDLERSCHQAMTQALDSSTVPLVQLEHMVRAALACGVKYAWFGKLHARPAHRHTPQNASCAEYDALHARCRAVVVHLQRAGLVSSRLTVEWVFQLLNGVVAAAVASQAANEAPTPQVGQFAWFSFSKGIGL